ncbi:hypothetical protein [Deinococcus frigens]|uniref:hypothetical protein n=1 Tax=Deinococcus frigens TaxID=249403 RepID=UPI00049807A2|nr:hypothetical protein [Deinococcus frigens]
MARQIRLTFDLSAELVAVLDAYGATHAPGSRDEAVAAAIRALRDRELDTAYAELGNAQRQGLDMYPPDHADGLPR